MEQCHFVWRIQAQQGFSEVNILITYLRTNLGDTLGTMARLCSSLGREDRMDEFFFDALPGDLFCLFVRHGLLGRGSFR